MIRMFSLIITLIFNSTMLLYSQTPGYHVIYGNRDGSTVYVGIGSSIEIGVWAATPAIGSGYEDLNSDGIVDSITFIHSPLASDNDYITSRNGGEVYFPLDQWDDVGYTTPNPLSNPPGYTNQSLLGFAQLSGPENILLNTEGDTVLIATFFMNTSADSANLGQLVCPFREGFDPANLGLLWGLPDGITEIIPLQTFSCVIFGDYLAGDANGSGRSDGVDVIYLVAYIKGYGPPPEPILAGDANGDCSTNLTDVSYLVNYCKGGPAPEYGDCD